MDFTPPLGSHHPFLRFVRDGRRLDLRARLAVHGVAVDLSCAADHGLSQAEGCLDEHRPLAKDGMLREDHPCGFRIDHPLNQDSDQRQLLRLFAMRAVEHCPWRPQRGPTLQDGAEQLHFILYVEQGGL